MTEVESRLTGEAGVIIKTWYSAQIACIEADWSRVLFRAVAVAELQFAFRLQLAFWCFKILMSQ
jgi:hypothetical protein